MSLSAESLNLNLRRKRVASERAVSNGDPLIARKKAREATTAPAPKKSTNVSLHSVLGHISDHFPNRKKLIKRLKPPQQLQHLKKAQMLVYTRF